MKRISNLEMRLNKFSPFDVHIALSQTAEHPLRIEEKAIVANTYHPLPSNTQADIKVYTNGYRYYLDVTQRDHNGCWRDQLVLPTFKSLVNIVDVIENILK
jgi:hypothetical protein